MRVSEAYTRPVGDPSLKGKRLDATEIKFAGRAPSFDTGRDFRAKLFVEMIGA